MSAPQPVEIRIAHDPGVERLLDGGRVLERVAVKAVARRAGTILLVRTDDGALMFPGGGVEPGEDDRTALRRELDEECGAALLGLGDHLVTTVQLSRPLEDDFDVFRMTSRYLGCEVGDPRGPRRLEDYEVALGMTPVWVDLDEAVETCARQVEAGTRHRWLARELAVLRALAGQPR